MFTHSNMLMPICTPVYHTCSHNLTSVHTHTCSYLMANLFPCFCLHIHAHTQSFFPTHVRAHTPLCPMLTLIHIAPAKLLFWSRCVSLHFVCSLLCLSA